MKSEKTEEERPIFARKIWRQTVRTKATVSVWESERDITFSVALSPTERPPLFDEI
jgi:hypothetical protein